MKNIHLIATDKPSRLHKIGNELGLTDKPNSNFLAKQQNIYITNDEEIKEGDNQWYLDKFLNKPRNSSGSQYGEKQDVIILTTDKDLIKDGVQAIDDDFLEWFVKNPSCEEVEVGYDKDVFPYGVETAKGCGWYKTIIPKEEPKQIKCYCGHTTYCDCSPIDEPKQEEIDFYAKELMLEKERAYKQEALEEEEVRKYAELSYYNGDEVNAFVNGAKWMQDKNKNKYSEEDMLDFAWYLIKNVGQYSDDRIAHFEGKYLEQFKKK